MQTTLKTAHRSVEEASVQSLLDEHRELTEIAERIEAGATLELIDGGDRFDATSTIRALVADRLELVEEHFALLRRACVHLQTELGIDPRTVTDSDLRPV